MPNDVQLSLAGRALLWLLHLHPLALPALVVAVMLFVHWIDVRFGRGLRR